MQKLLRQCARLAAVRTPQNGTQNTSLPFLYVLRADQTSELRYGVLEPSFCLILQGRKRMHLGQSCLEYGTGGYLASVLAIPTSGQIIEAPYLAVRITFEPREIAAVVLEASFEGKPGPAALVDHASGALVDCIRRLLLVLDSPPDAAFLAESLKRETLYRLLQGSQSRQLIGNVLNHDKDLGISRAVYWLRSHFREPLRIEELARTTQMSVSSLHHKFKAATAMGPLQYQKQLRLQEARRLLFAGEVDAGAAAVRVGYESQSQFSREYRSFFGAPPLQHIKSMQGHFDVPEER